MLTAATSSKAYVQAGLALPVGPLPVRLCAWLLRVCVCVTAGRMHVPWPFDTPLQFARQPLTVLPACTERSPTMRRSAARLAAPPATLVPSRPAARAAETAASRSWAFTARQTAAQRFCGCFRTCRPSRPRRSGPLPGGTRHPHLPVGLWARPRPPLCGHLPRGGRRRLGCRRSLHPRKRRHRPGPPLLQGSLLPHPGPPLRLHSEFEGRSTPPKAVKLLTEGQGCILHGQCAA